jgi:hypothetical protein
MALHTAIARPACAPPPVIVRLNDALRFRTIVCEARRCGPAPRCYKVLQADD